MLGLQSLILINFHSNIVLQWYFFTSGNLGAILIYKQVLIILLKYKTLTQSSTYREPLR